jgi:cell division protein FtsI/penicillin-binding protein 2
MRRRDGEIEFDARQFRARARLLAAAIALTAMVLLGRSLQLQVFDRQFIAMQADMRHARTARIVAHRGSIQDRFGEPLAASSPVETVWVNPPEFAEAGEGIPRLARALKLNRQWLEQRVTSNLDREFLYVKRHVEPADASVVRALELPGVYFQREYKRFYPNTEVTGHLLGFTSLDEAGQEGLELAFDRTLHGVDGAKRVIQDGRGRVIQNVEVVRAPVEGQDLVTSVDLRIQYLAYRELKAAIRQHRARAGTVIVLDIATGEVLAMVNQPSFNPNDRAQYEVSRYRNRAVTDIFEPGSSIKPFVVAAALASGRYRGQHHRRDAVQGRHARHPRPPRPRRHRHGRRARALEQRGDGEDRAHPRPQPDARDAARARLRRGDRERLSRRVRRPPDGSSELALDQRRDHGLRLRAVGHTAAARAGLLDDRRLRHPPAGVVPARGRAARGRARAAGEGRT